jgi:hypothetical protein
VLLLLQPPRNVTVFEVAMRGQGVRLTEEQARQLAVESAAAAVPLAVEVMVPVHEGDADVDGGRQGAVRRGRGQAGRERDGGEQGVQGEGQAALVVAVIARRRRRSGVMEHG